MFEFVGISRKLRTMSTTSSSNDIEIDIYILDYQNRLQGEPDETNE